MLYAHFFCSWVNLVVHPQFHSGDSLLQLVVIARRAFCVDDHSRRHQPRAGAHGEIQPDIRFINRELVSLHALRQVRLIDFFFQQSQELRLRLFRSPACTNYAAPNINLRAQDALNEGLDRLVDTREPRLCQT